MGGFKMSGFVSRSLTVSALALLMTINSAVAQDAAKPYEPRVGQAGKDVVWVPSPQALVDRMLDMARVTVDDYVIDLGSGDGRTVITAAKRGVKALGIEYNPDLVEVSKSNAAAAGVTDLASFVQGDIFESDFSKATVITLFLLSDLNLKLRPTLLEMKPGTRVVSNTFDMSDWEPDDRISAENCTAYCKASFWIVPAKVAGTWRLPEGELTLEQKFQMLSGTLKSGNGSQPITGGKMHGEEITFMVGDRIYRGKVEGNRMEGVFATETKWQATRQ
jgi:SAM-dependent methyltransferase